MVFGWFRLQKLKVSDSWRFRPVESSWRISGSGVQGLGSRAEP